MTNVFLGRRVSAKTCDRTVLEVITGPMCDVIEFALDKGPTNAVREIPRSINRKERDGERKRLVPILLDERTNRTY